MQITKTHLIFLTPAQGQCTTEAQTSISIVCSPSISVRTKAEETQNLTFLRLDMKSLPKGCRKMPAKSTNFQPQILNIVNFISTSEIEIISHIQYNFYRR